jgi:hypothetical protein
MLRGEVVLDHRPPNYWSLFRCVVGVACSVSVHLITCLTCLCVPQKEGLDRKYARLLLSELPPHVAGHPDMSSERFPVLSTLLSERERERARRHEEEADEPDDVPVVAVCGSGPLPGGALVAPEDIDLDALLDELVDDVE